MSKMDTSYLKLNAVLISTAFVLCVAVSLVLVWRAYCILSMRARKPTERFTFPTDDDYETGLTQTGEDVAKDMSDITSRIGNASDSTTPLLNTNLFDTSAQIEQQVVSTTTPTFYIAHPNYVDSSNASCSRTNTKVFNSAYVNDVAPIDFGEKFGTKCSVQLKSGITQSDFANYLQWLKDQDPVRVNYRDTQGIKDERDKLWNEIKDTNNEIQKLRQLKPTKEYETNTAVKNKNDKEEELRNLRSKVAPPLPEPVKGFQIYHPDGRPWRLEERPVPDNDLFWAKDAIKGRLNAVRLNSGRPMRVEAYRGTQIPDGMVALLNIDPKTQKADTQMALSHWYFVLWAWPIFDDRQPNTNYNSSWVFKKVGVINAIINGVSQLCYQVEIHCSFTLDGSTYVIGYDPTSDHILIVPVANAQKVQWLIPTDPDLYLPV